MCTKLKPNSKRGTQTAGLKSFLSQAIQVIVIQKELKQFKQTLEKKLVKKQRTSFKKKTNENKKSKQHMSKFMKLTLK